MWWAEISEQFAHTVHKTTDSVHCLLISSAKRRIIYIRIESLKTILGETIMSQTQTGPNRESRPSTPRWVKVLVIILIVLVLLIVILHLTGNDFGGHHMSSIEYWLQQL